MADMRIDSSCCFRQYRDSVLMPGSDSYVRMCNICLVERLLWQFDARLQNRAGTDLRPDMYYSAIVRLVRKGLQGIPVEYLLDVAGEHKQLALAVGFTDELQADR